MSPWPALVVDLGGTHLRLGLVADLMRGIPTSVIIRPYPGLTGAAAALAQDNGHS